MLEAADYGLQGNEVTDFITFGGLTTTSGKSKS